MLCLLGLILATCKGHGLYMVDGEVVRLGSQPEITLSPIVYDYERTVMEELLADGDRLILLAVNPWCEDTLSKVFEEAAILTNSFPDWLLNPRVKLMMLGKAFEQSRFLKERFDLNHETQCASLITVDQSHFKVVDLAAEMSVPSDKWLYETIMKERLRKKQDQVHSISKLTDLENLVALNIPSLLIFTSFLTKSTPHALKSHGFCLDIFNRQRGIEN